MDKEDFFVQMPYTILESTLTNNAKVLFMHFWKDAFTNNKKYKGKHYSDMIETEMANKLRCTRKTARGYLNKLHSAKVIETQKGRFRSKHFFLSKSQWKLIKR